MGVQVNDDPDNVLRIRMALSEVRTAHYHLVLLLPLQFHLKLSTSLALLLMFLTKFSCSHPSHWTHVSFSPLRFLLLSFSFSCLSLAPALPVLQHLLTPFSLQASRDLVLLQETFEYLRESMEYLRPPPPPDNPMSKRLFRVMKLDSLLGNIRVRVDDIEKILDGASNELINLQQ
eukprot:748586-Hanusia_phi.AAC.1